LWKSPPPRPPNPPPPPPPPARPPPALPPQVLIVSGGVGGAPPAPPRPPRPPRPAAPLFAGPRRLSDSVATSHSHFELSAVKLNVFRSFENVIDVNGRFCGSCA